MEMLNTTPRDGITEGVTDGLKKHADEIGESDERLMSKLEFREQMLLVFDEKQLH